MMDSVMDGSLSDKEMLGRYARRFLECDDAIKSASRELKPMREAVREAKERSIELMKACEFGSISVPEYGCTLNCATKSRKRAPSREEIGQRALEYCGGDAARAGVLMERLFARVEEDRDVFSRRKARRGARDDVPPGGSGDEGGVARQDQDFASE